MNDRLSSLLAGAPVAWLLLWGLALAARPALAQAQGDAAVDGPGERAIDAADGNGAQPLPTADALPDIEVVPVLPVATAQPDREAPGSLLANLGRKASRRGRQRGRADARRGGLAATYASIAAQADLTGAATIEAPMGMADGSEHTVVPARAPEPPPVQPQTKIAPPIPAASGVLDERIVKEINRRKTSFRLCYESARRRGVTVTRADVKWILESDGNVRDVQVEVAQDEYLATCLGVVASQPFPTGIGQEVPVAIPLLFLIAR